MVVYPAAAVGMGWSRVRFRSQRSGSQSDRSSAVGFSPSANSPGNASRRYANGSIPRCLHVPMIEYSTAAVRPPTSLPITPQLFRPNAIARSVRSDRLLSIARYPRSR